MTRSSKSPVALIQLTTEPSNLWAQATVRFGGRSDVPWVDLRSRDLGGLEDSIKGAPWRSSTLPRSIYLPPPAEDEVDTAVALRSWCASEDIAVVEHRVAGTGEAVLQERQTLAWDLLDVVLSGRWDRLGSLAPGALFLWPLVAGLSDGGAAVERGLDRLAPLQPSRVVPVVPELSPRARRALADASGEDVFGAVFHGVRADARSFAAACRSRRIDFLPRRLAPPIGVESAPRLAPLVAAELALIADLSIDVGESEARAQLYYGAARWFEATRHDVRGLLREGNLDVVPRMDSQIATVVAELASGAERSTLLETLTRRFARRVDEGDAPR